MKFKTLYKEVSGEYRLWEYYIFINKHKMIIIDGGFEELELRDNVMWSFIKDSMFDEVDVNKLVIEKQKFLIRNILNV